MENFSEALLECSLEFLSPQFKQDRQKDTKISIEYYDQSSQSAEKYQAYFQLLTKFCFFTQIEPSQSERVNKTLKMLSKNEQQKYQSRDWIERWEQIYEKEPAAFRIQQISILLSTLNERYLDQELSGSYYTPHFITEYICANSLFSWISAKFSQISLKTKEKQIKEDLIGYFRGSTTKSDLLHNIFAQPDEFVKVWDHCIQILRDATICDPAVGTGAFLIQYLSIFHQLERKINSLLIETKTQSPSIHDRLSKILEINKFPINSALFLIRMIEHNVVGVDILQNSVEITKIRLLLNLCCYYSIQDLEEWIPISKWLSTPIKNANANFPLKNHILQGNSLVGFIDLPMNHQKNDSLTKQHHSSISSKLDFQYYTKQSPLHWQQQLQESGFLKPHTTFAGFSIMVGNPPYINNKKLAKNLKILMKDMGYESAYKLYDYSVLFIERGIQLLQPNGVLSYITTNKFISTDYGIKIREYLLEKTQLLEFIDVSQQEVFQSIATYPLILTTQKSAISSQEKAKASIKLFPNIDSEEKFRELPKYLTIIKHEVFDQTPNHIFDISGNAQICDRIRKRSDVLLADLKEEWRYRPLGFTNWKDQTKFISSKPPIPGDQAIPFIGCANIKEFYVDWDSALNLNRQKYHHAWLYSQDPAQESQFKRWSQYFEPQIFLKEVGKKITATFEYLGIDYLGTELPKAKQTKAQPGWGHLTGIYALKINPSKISYQTLSILLNSRLLSFYYNAIYGAVHMAGGYLNYHSSYLDQLPIKIPDITFQQVFDICYEILAFKFRFSHLNTQEEILSELNLKINDNSINIESMIKEVLNDFVYYIYFPESIPRNLVQPIITFFKRLIDSTQASLKEWHQLYFMNHYHKNSNEPGKFRLFMTKTNQILLHLKILQDISLIRSIENLTKKILSTPELVKIHENYLL